MWFLQLHHHVQKHPKIVPGTSTFIKTYFGSLPALQILLGNKANGYVSAHGLWASYHHLKCNWCHTHSTTPTMKLPYDSMPVFRWPLALVWFILNLWKLQNTANAYAVCKLLCCCDQRDSRICSSYYCQVSHGPIAFRLRFWTGTVIQAWPRPQHRGQMD